MMAGVLHTRVSRRVAISTIFGVFVGIPVIGHFALTWRPRKFYKAYDRLHIGLSEAETVEIFSRKPDSVCTLDVNRIFYYSRRAITDTHPAPPEIIAATQSEIPWFYGSAQLLLDTDGKLSAFTINGEESYIATREGKLKGSSLQQVDAATFEKLCRSTM